MLTTKSAHALCAMTALATLVTGCSNGTEATTATSAPTISSSVSTSDAAPATTDQSTAPSEAPQTDEGLETAAPGPTAAELEDQGQQAAAEAVEEAWAMLDKVSQDPEVEVQELAKVARGQAVAQWVSNIQSRRERDSIQSGDTKVTVTHVETVTAGERYEVTACLDLTKVEFNGVKPERGEFGDLQQITYVVRPDAGGPELYVTDDPMEYEACGA